MERSEIIKKTKELTLLYVEDEVSVRSFTTMLFNNYFKSVEEAEDGQEGFEKFLEGSYDVVITDRNLPKKSGEELIEEILEINDSQKLVLMTAENDKSYEVLNNKSVYFLNKPLMIDEFDTLLSRIIE